MPEILKRFPSKKFVKETDTFMRFFGKDNYFPDSLIFMDKSARLIANIFKNLVYNYYSNMENYWHPHIVFMDLGQIITEDDRVSENVRTAYGKYLQPNTSSLVVDEASFSGIALERSVKFLKQTFPNINFNTKVVYSEFPPWYGKSELLGVQDRSRGDWIQEAIERVNQRIGSSFSYEEYVSIPEDVKAMIQHELNLSLGENELDLKIFANDVYKEKKLSTIIWGLRPVTKRSGSNKESAISFRREQMNKVCQQILDYKAQID